MSREEILDKTSEVLMELLTEAKSAASPQDKSLAVEAAKVLMAIAMVKY